HGRYALVYAPFPFRTLAQSTRLRVGNIADFLAMALGLCTPLRQMHAQGLVHSDIKPGNFFIDPGGAYRLAGFGLTTGSDKPDGARWDAGLYVPGAHRAHPR
uniref:hypothetical protein n=1 Tax=Pseudescherichia sp. TaxID=2055881 RepID=UPI0028AB865A